MKKKRLKRELRALAKRNSELEDAHRRLATHASVIALAVRTPDRVPEQDLDDAIVGLNTLSESKRQAHAPASEPPDPVLR